MDIFNRYLNSALLRLQRLYSFSRCLMPFEEGVYWTEEGGQFIYTTGDFMIVVPEKLQFENVDKRLIHNKTECE